MPLILSGNVASATADAGYTVANSCRFNDDDNPKMTVTPSSSGTNAGLKYTLSAWVKLGNIGADKTIWSCSSDTYIYITGAGIISCNFRRDGGTNYQYESTRRLRDPSAWYHIVMRVDTTDSTDADKVQVYVNNEEDTPSITSYQNMADDFETGGNVSGIEQRIGVYSDGSLDFDGYMAEVIMVDNQSLAPTSFGEYDSDTPTIWKPKDISDISVGTNGYYLDFEDSSNLGNNAAGSGSADLTETNLAAADQATDTPTNNFCTMNPLDNYIPASTFSEGNLKVVTQSTGYQYNTATFGLTAGKWYYEMKLISKTGAEIVGIAGRVCGNSLHYLGYYNDGWGYHSYDGKSKNNETGTSYGDTWDVDDTVVGVFIDLDNNKLYFAKDGTIQNSGTGISITDPASVNDGAYYPAVGDNWNGGIGTYEMNFGNPTWSLSSAVADANGYGSFEYDPSDGGSSSFDSAAKDFLAICTKNLAEYG